MANGRTAREEKIIKAMVAGTSPAALAADTGWDEGLITREYHRIASEFDTVMDDRQQLQVNKMVLRRHIARLEAEAEEGNKDAWKPLVDAVAKQNQQIDKSLDRTQEDLEKVSSAQARVLLEIVQSSFDRTLGELQARYPKADVSEIENTFRSHLVQVASERDEP